MKRIPLALTIASIIIISTCKKIDLVRLMAVKNGEVTSTMATEVTVTGEIIDMGQGIDEYGFCYSANNQQPVINYYDGSFYREGGSGHWWSATSSDSERAWSRYLAYDLDQVDRFYRN
jgi:hypothetical protein